MHYELDYKIILDILAQCLSVSPKDIKKNSADLQLLGKSEELYDRRNCAHLGNHLEG
jgi:hypothetical protein